MGFRPTFDIQHKQAEDPLVDKKIGNAYKTVEYVAEHMDELIALANQNVSTQQLVVKTDD